MEKAISFMRTPQWIKKLGGHAGELYVAAEMSKRGIANALLPENFSDDDILFGLKGGAVLGYVQVKSCHPDRNKSWQLDAKNEEWINAPKNEFVVLVWLGSPSKNESPRFWIATKQEVGKHLIKDPNHGTRKRGRRIQLQHKNPDLVVHKEWENNWILFESVGVKQYVPLRT